MIKLKFSDLLPEAVKNEFEQLSASLKAFLLKGHNEDGTHGDIVADSLTIQGGQLGVYYDLPYDAARYVTDTGTVTWTVAEAGQTLLRAMRVGSRVEVLFDVTGTLASGAGDKAGAVIIRLPEFFIRAFNEKGAFLDFSYVNLGAGSNATDGSFPTKAWATTFLTRGVAGIYIERFNKIERLGASTMYGNYPNESTRVTGMAVFESSLNNEPVSYEHP